MTMLERIRNKQSNPVSKPRMTALEALAQLGHTSFREGQEEAVNEVVNGKDGILAVFPTGAGKSMLYQVPSLMTDKLVVVVSPLISLMKDQVDKLQGLGINAVFINSSVPAKDAKIALMEASTGSIRALYVAPERFDNEEFTKTMEGIEIDIFALDESHCISRWGNDFRPSYARLGGIIEKLKPRQVIALTATATIRVQDDICQVLGIPNAKRFIKSIHRPNLAFEMFPNIGKDSRVNVVFEIAKEHLDNGHKTGIVYVPTRKEAESLSDKLNKKGLKSIFYHAGMTGSLRTEIQEQWMKEGGIVIATCAFGMGIDRPDVRFVVFVGLAQGIEDWYQAMGRAGRDGEDSLCLTLYDMAEDYRTQKFLIDLTNPASKDVVSFWKWARMNAKDGKIQMTQEEMGKAARCVNAGGCISALKTSGRMRTLGRGSYEVNTEAGDIGNLEPMEEVRKEKLDKLDEVARFYRSRDCRIQYLCGYFGDVSFSGQCNKCDNCRK